MRWVAVVLIALSLSGCESSQEESAKLEKAAKLHEAASRSRAATANRELTIAHPSRKISVRGVQLLRSSEGSAVVVTLQNHSSQALREVPVRVIVRDAARRTLYTNETPGQSPALISASLIPAHASVEWIDDQVQAEGQGLSASAEVGEAAAVAGKPPALTVSGAHMIEDPTNGPGAEGDVVNHSSIAQSELVVYGIARRGSRIVAAGRAVLPSAAAGASTRFQLFFIGEPAGASLEVSAPPSTLG